jgi:hypothetical protein
VIIKVWYGVLSRRANAGICAMVLTARSRRCGAVRCSAVQRGAVRLVIRGRAGCGEKAASEAGACCWLGPRPLLAARNGWRKCPQRRREDNTGCSTEGHLPGVDVAKSLVVDAAGGEGMLVRCKGGWRVTRRFASLRRSQGVGRGWRRAGTEQHNQREDAVQARVAQQRCDEEAGRGWCR